jgi:hypothetical protein
MSSSVDLRTYTYAVGNLKIGNNLVVFIIIVFVTVVVVIAISCHRPFLPGSSLEPGARCGAVG